MSFEEISDDWLICMFYEKNQDAIDFLFARYEIIVYAIINELQKKDGSYLDFDELYQEGMFAFLKCIERYEEENGRFYFFAKVVIERKLRDKIKQINKYRKILSLDSSAYIDGNVNYIDSVAEESAGYLDNDLYERLINKLDDKCKNIVDMRMMGYAYQEIAGIMGISKQGIYRRVNKIKNILKDIIEKID